MLKSNNYLIQRDSYKATIIFAGAQTLVIGEVVRPIIITIKDSTIIN